MNNPGSTALENPAPTASPPDQTGGIFEQALEQCDEKQLWPMLLCIQQRLGTPSEQSTDLAQVRAIAHRLCNVLATIRIRSELIQMKRQHDHAGHAGCIGQ